MPRKPTFALILLLAGVSSALADTLPAVDCSGCATLNDFGNYGAAVLYQAVGVSGPAVGSDRIWVRNPNTGKKAFVDVDTPVRLAIIYSVTVPLPDFTKQEVNVTWSNGSASAAYELPVEIIDAIGETLNAEYGAHAAEPSEAQEPEIPLEEFDRLPGFNGNPWQYMYLPQIPFTLINGGWEFSVQRVSGSVTPVVEVVECAWHSGC
jgi:hypothetical protein